MESAARTVLNDWNSGKIPYFSLPPADSTVHLSAEIKSEWSAAFEWEAADEQIMVDVQDQKSFGTEFVSMNSATTEVDMDAIPDYGNDVAPMDESDDGGSTSGEESDE